MDLVSGRLFAQADAPSQKEAPKTSPQTSPQTSTQTSEDRSTTFRSVEGGNQMQSGEKLLVEAYAAIWVILFAMLFFSWRRQRAMERRIEGLEQSVTRARKSASKTEGVEGVESAEDAESASASEKG